jgi:uncharacterized cupredoxin-like copper-binding protein
VRNVVVEVDDAKRVTPANWQARQGETVRLIVVNTGQIRHELVVGPAQELATHAESMKSSGEHGHENGVTVGPGQTSTLLYTFNQPGQWGIACLEPGHYDSGMKGSVDVGPST